MVIAIIAFGAIFFASVVTGILMFTKKPAKKTTKKTSEKSAE
jgi:flagellar basal body-associated protein FliL